jgi:hypothetical protein
MKFLLDQESTESQAMRSFPMNEKACFNYGRKCPYFDFCTAWSNPLERCEQVPLGFIHEVWNPTDLHTNVTLDLTKPEEVEAK